MTPMVRMPRIVVGLCVAAGAAVWLAAPGAGTAKAIVGEAAPAFTLHDASGHERSLAEFAGKFVVLEWFNKDCPFVRRHYDANNMQALQSAYTQRGVVWLTVASSAPGNQGYIEPSAAQAVVQDKGLRSTALLLDPDGVVGKAYGAMTTPHLFIINPEGAVIYTGAIDDTPSTDPADLGTAKNYVAQALDEALEGKPVSNPTTASYGCSVKY